MGYIGNPPNKDFWLIKDNRNVTEEFLHYVTVKFFQFINIRIFLWEVQFFEFYFNLSHDNYTLLLVNNNH